MSVRRYTKHGFKLWLPGQTTPNKLFRLGNSLSPRLSNLRYVDMPGKSLTSSGIYVPYFNHHWHTPGAQGISTFRKIYRTNEEDYPFGTSYPVAKNVWSLEKGSLIVPGLALVQDNKDKFVFVPEIEMKESEYVEALNIQGQTERNAKFLQNQNPWIFQNYHESGGHSFEEFYIQIAGNWVQYESYGINRAFIDGLYVLWDVLLSKRNQLYEESQSTLNLSIEDTISEVETDMHHLNSLLLSMRNGATLVGFLNGQGWKTWYHWARPRHELLLKALRNVLQDLETQESSAHNEEVSSRIRWGLEVI